MVILNYTGKHSIKIANYFLLSSSYALYAQHNPFALFVLLFVTFVTYFGARLIENFRQYKKALIYGLVTLALTPLFFYKYYDFFKQVVMDAMGGEFVGEQWIVPIGLSFFTFQALSYLYDVYYEKIKTEKNLWDYMLFVAFFPQILSGPINRANELLPQIKNNRSFNYEKTAFGFKQMLYGMFLKVVLADRLGMYVDTVYGDWSLQTGVTCAVASVAYSLQIYADFAGYSLMAIGVGHILGFDFANNFNRPYFSVSVKDFWHRWHISLSSWLRDYVYIPLGGSRCSKKRNYVNIMITFLVSGIWHGANWTFIVWGLIHGLFQVIEKILGLNKRESKNCVEKAIRILVTFFVVNLVWIFFRMPSLSESVDFICYTAANLTGKLFLPDADKVLYLTIALFIFAIKEFLDEYKPQRVSLWNSKHIMIRYITYVAMIFLIFMIGVLDSGNFIYLNF